MKGRLHGLVSVLMALVALGIGVIAVWQHSFIFGVLYIFIIIVAFSVILYSYCAKCPSRHHCGHVIIGGLTKLFPKRTEAPYTLAEYIAVIMGLGVMIALPQYWLWQNRGLFIAFWGLMLFTVVEIRLFVCTRCTNHFCQLCSQKKIA